MSACLIFLLVFRLRIFQIQNELQINRRNEITEEEKGKRWKYNRKFRLRTIRYTHSHRLEFHWNEKTLLPFIVAFLLPVSAKI